MSCNVFCVLYRAANEQVATSRNLMESPWMKICRAFWAMWFLLRGFRHGFCGIFREQLGSRVLHKGKTYWISNWAGSSAPTLSGNGEYLYSVPRSEIVSVTGFRERAHRFSYMFGWYFDSWHAIDVNKKLY